MKKSKVAALVAGALVVGLTVGSLGIADAAMRHTARHTHVSMQTRAFNAAMHAVSPVATLSKLTGLSIPAIMQLRAQGESFAQIATDNGIDPSTLVAQIVAARKANLDTLVAAGKLTAAQETAILNHITAMVTTMVDRTPGTGMMTTSTVDPTGTMVPGTPNGPMGPGAGSGSTTMTPGTAQGPMGPGAGSGSATMTPGTPAGPMGTGSGYTTGTMTPGTHTGTGTMVPGSGMTSGTTAPHSGPGMM